VASQPSDAGSAALSRQVARVLVWCEVVAVAAIALAILIDLAHAVPEAAVPLVKAGVLALLAAPFLALGWIAFTTRADDRGRLAAYALATMAVAVAGALIAR
jgi:hypothetical protein